MIYTYGHMGHSILLNLRHTIINNDCWEATPNQIIHVRNFKLPIRKYTKANILDLPKL